jgi:CRP-like cAMP-binding protein
MKTIADLRALADEKLYAGELDAALHVYAAIVRLMPNALDVRLRVGDTLLALGEVQRAAEVYAVLAKHAANAGHPLVALVAIKILEKLDPQLGVLLDSIGGLYGRGSGRLGKGVRISQGDPSQPLPPDLAFHATPERSRLVAAAAKVATGLEGIDAYPPVLPPIPLFSELPGDAFGPVLRAIELRRVRPGEHVVRQGDVGQSFFVLARGRVHVERETPDGRVVELARLSDGSLFGEMALVFAQPRTAHVVSNTDADLLEFDRDALTAAAREVSTIAVALEKFTRERLVQNLLATSPLFKPLDRDQRVDLARRFVANDVPAGFDIVSEGAPGQGLYVLLTGEVDVSKRDGNDKILLATLHAGEVFGEIALLSDGPTTATVTAATNANVLFLQRDIFQKLVAAFPAIRDYVEGLSDERMMDTRLTMSQFESEEVLELDDDDIVIL